MKHFHRLSNGKSFGFNVDSDSDEIPLSESFVHLAKTTPQSEDHLKHLVSKSLQGLRSGYSPTLCESGVGGTYFMRDEYNRTIGVFKPHDEEMGCMNNPKVSPCLHTPLLNTFHLFHCIRTLLPTPAPQFLKHQHSPYYRGLLLRHLPSRTMSSEVRKLVRPPSGNVLHVSFGS